MEQGLTASLEDYLEAIYQTILEKRVARPKDIAKRLKIRYPSVTGALKLLSGKKLINYEPYDHITLTEEGESLAKDVVRRHEILRDFFVEILSVPYREADEAACKLEHAIPKPLVDRFLRFIEFVLTCPRGGANWIKGFSHYCNDAVSKDSCQECILNCLDDLRRNLNKKDGEKMTMKLKDLLPKQKARVTNLQGDPETTKRLMDMGLTPGSVIELERVAPLGDPVDIKVKGYHLSLRKDEAERIEVSLLT